MTPTGKIDKGWGFEIVWASTENYCAKLLCFAEAGSKMSLHFHKDKDETWFINAGKFKVRWIDTTTATYHEQVLAEGSVWHNPPLRPHQLESLTNDAVIFEVSTKDTPEDNYRVVPGDSQTKML
jgi:mannose-6-phosphate isomerase-like protein (cupin superfamily)